MFINGIPAAGKTTVANLLTGRIPGFHVLTGDDLIREVPHALRLRLADRIWSRMLNVIEERLTESHLLVDSALPARQIQEARDRLGTVSGFVILRIDEVTRAARQRERDVRGNPLGLPWQLEYHAIPGPDAMYDLVLDSARLSSEHCADAIAEFVTERWPLGF